MEPVKHEKGARKGGVRMFLGLREHEVRSNPGYQNRKGEGMLAWRSMTLEPIKHEKEARKGGVRMILGLREHEVRSNLGYQNKREEGMPVWSMTLKL